MYFRRVLRTLRPLLVLLVLFLTAGLVIVSYQAMRTLQQLTAVEAARDLWQEPAKIIEALALQKGDTVVDLGSGAGYFALKLSDSVGADGAVIAVDLRRMSLAFLRARALLRGKHNIRPIVGETDNPHLSAAKADAVLIVNTYHEMTEPQAILRHTWSGLRAGGRLVIVDRTPAVGEPHRDGTHFHAAPDNVEADLGLQGFTIVRRDDAFIHPAGDDAWWLIVARKPQS